MKKKAVCHILPYINEMGLNNNKKQEFKSFPVRTLMPFSWNPVPGAKVCLELTRSLRSLRNSRGQLSALLISDAKSVHFVKHDHVIFFPFAIGNV